GVRNADRMRRSRGVQSTATELNAACESEGATGRKRAGAVSGWPVPELRRSRELDARARRSVAGQYEPELHDLRRGAGSVPRLHFETWQSNAQRFDAVHGRFSRPVWRVAADHPLSVARYFTGQSCAGGFGGGR